MCKKTWKEYPDGLLSLIYEEKGISEEYLELCDKTVKIPMTGTTQSLNVSVATGIVLFEIVKQRL